MAGAIACLIGLGIATSVRSHASPSRARAIPIGGRLSALLSSDSATIGPRAERRIARAAWQGGATTASTGETVNINVADSIPDADSVRQKWADFLAGLIHGAELSLLTVYVVPGTEVGADCGGPSILGCYGQQQLLIPNDVVQGVTPEEIARHEYGHHVANNRLNAPWRAIDWGPKRWASQINVCSSAQQGLVFPGDETDRYRLNPGEAWAETYRVLNETKAGLPVTWPIVDSRFMPDPTALTAAEQDVTTPWTLPTVHVYRNRFTRGKKLWTLPVATLLDGDMKVTLTLPPSHVYHLTLLGVDGKTVLATGLWTAQTAQVLTFTLCGQRSAIVRVVGDRMPGKFTVVTATP